MTKERSLLSSIVSKLMLILAIAGLLVAPMPQRLHADDEVTTSAAKVEETNTGLKAKLSVTVSEVKTAHINGAVLSPVANEASSRDRYANRPLVISDEFGGRSGNPLPVPTSSENNFRTDSTGTTPGEGNFQTLPSGRVLVKSDEFNFRTLPSGRTVVVSPESSFTTASDAASDADEHSFTTLSEDGGGGCTNCGGSNGSRRRPPAKEPPSSCPLYLREFIKLGQDNDKLEVLKLQYFLRYFEDLEVPLSGVYDQTTYQAVHTFQARYGQDVLGPWGILESTGYVFITTRLAINNIYCERSTANDLDLRNFYPELAAGLANLDIGLDVLDEAEANLDEVGTSTIPTIPTDIVGSVEDVDGARNLFQVAALGLLEWLGDSAHIFNLILILIIIALAIWALKLEQELKRRNRGSAPANLPVAKEVGEDLEEPEEEGVLKNLDDEDDWDNWLDDDSQPTLDKLN